MKKNKKMLVMLVVLFVIFGGSVVYGASTSTSVSITIHDYSKASDSVGVSTSAYYTAANSYYSTSNMTMKAYACWTGWPYTCEFTNQVAPSGNYAYTEYQDRNSNFYIELIGYNACNGSGTVRAN